MVYYGAISKACSPCRSKRLQCDLGPKGCGQCTRAGIICTGYRDPKTLRWRDQTAIVQKKQTIKTLNLEVCQEARTIFFEDYVAGEMERFHFIQHYYSTREDYLNTSINAVSLAYLNHRKPSASTRREALAHYVKALRLTSRAIQNPEARNDSLLMSAMLLDMYEKISTQQPHHDGAGTTHLDGALLLLRHSRQSYPDIEYFLNTNLLINSVVTGRAMSFASPQQQQNSQISIAEQYDIRTIEAGLMIAFATLTNKHTHHDITLQEVLCAATALDKQFEMLSQSIEYQHQKIMVSQKTIHHYEDYHYFFQQERLAHVWNFLRLTRVILCDLILSCCPEGPNDEWDYAINVVQQMSEEIFAVVPPLINPERVFRDRPAVLHTGNTGKEKQYLPSYKLIFPIYVAAQSRAASASAKRYAIGQLRLMADMHGMEKASVVANLLENRSEENPWNVFALLGSYAFIC